MAKSTMFLKSQGLKFLKFQMIPFPFCGMMITMFALITSFTDFQAGIKIFDVLLNPVFVIMVGVLSAEYIYSLYKEQFEAKYQVGNMKHFHKGLALFTGVFAAFIPYLFSQFGFFFTTIASEADFDIQSVMVPIGQWEIPAIFVLPFITVACTVIIKEIFFSMDDKKHLFLTSILERSYLEEYLIKIYKFFKRT